MHLVGFIVRGWDLLICKVKLNDFPKHVNNSQGRHFCLSAVFKFDEKFSDSVFRFSTEIKNRT